MGIKIISRHANQRFRIVLPGLLIFLIFLLILPLLIVVILLTMVGLLLWNLAPGDRVKARAYTRIVFSVPKLILALRGLTIDVESEDTIIKINF